MFGSAQLFVFEKKKKKKKLGRKKAGSCNYRAVRKEVGSVPLSYFHQIVSISNIF